MMIYNQSVTYLCRNTIGVFLNLLLAGMQIFLSRKDNNHYSMAMLIFFYFAVCIFLQIFEAINENCIIAVFDKFLFVQISKYL